MSQELKYFFLTKKKNRKQKLLSYKLMTDFNVLKLNRPNNNDNERWRLSLLRENY